MRSLEEKEEGPVRDANSQSSVTPLDSRPHFLGADLEDDKLSTYRENVKTYKRNYERSKGKNIITIS